MPWEEIGRRVPGVAVGGANLAVRLLRALLVIVRSVIVAALLFGIAGVVYGLYLTGFVLGDSIAIHALNEEVIWLGLAGVFLGGLVGLLWGFLRALQVLFSSGD